ncbi:MULTISPECIES: branched-chain amino acid ABC transporter permease [unclassified Candidatus Paralachnospira]|uniref:branched-chain amino acid ABC transporter permease n=1 Tax=unclassified Candidatus Paralachnospira TaxID=3099471 RepID=UPI003F8F4296
MTVQYLVNGLTMGLIYALIAVGYSLVFGILKMINMAHGAIYAFGAHMILMFVTWNLGTIPAVILSIIFTGGLLVIYDRSILALLRKKKAPGIAALVTTIGFSYIITNGLQILFGTEIKSFPALLGTKMIEIGNIKFALSQVYILIVSVILLVGLSLLIHKSKIGLAMQAVEQNPRAADLMGINAKAVISVTFFLSGMSAVIAALLLASYYQTVYPTMGAMIGLKGFSASVLGGIGVLYGSAIGGIILGIAESLTVQFLSGAYRDAVAFVLLFIVLIIRPNGLFGKAKISKV